MIIKNFGTKIPVFFNMRRIFITRFAYILGLLNWIHIHETAMIIPKISFLMSKEFIQSMNSKGVSVIVFGISGSESFDSEKTWLEVCRAGANGICSDNPTKLKSWLQLNPLNPCYKLQ